MGERESMSRGEAFIVRFWRDETWEHREGWRGVVIHVPTGERVPVRSPAEAVQVMSAYLSAQADLPDVSPHVDNHT